MNLLKTCILVLVAASPIAHLTAQRPPVLYGGDQSGIWVTVPASSGGITVQPQPPVIPGGPGTEPDNGADSEMHGWNGSTGSFDVTNPAATDVDGAKAYGKLQTVTVKMDPPPPDTHWECTGAAKVGGFASAQLISAYGHCHAAAESKTTVIYGGEKLVAEDKKAVAVAEQGHGLIGATITPLGFTTTYLIAGSSALVSVLADSDPGKKARADGATIDYVQKGDMAYQIRANSGTPAQCKVKAEAKGSATLEFVVVAGT